MENNGQTYDDVTGIWSVPEKDFGFNKNQLVGPAILYHLSILDDSKVLEINHKDGKETTVREMRKLVITCVLNLKRIGIEKGDIVVFLTHSNSYTTPTCYACFIVGAVVNPINVGLSNGEFGNY